MSSHPSPARSPSPPPLDPDSDLDLDLEEVTTAVETTHDGGMAATVTTAISEIFNNGEDFVAEGADFFANPTQIQASEGSGDEQEDDIAAKWKAALASDELLDDDFLPDDDEGFLSEGDGTDAPPSDELKPIEDASGRLQGFSNVTITGALSTGAPSNVSTYAPQNSTPGPSQGPYQPPQQPYVVPDVGWQPSHGHYAPVQQPVAPQAYIPAQTSAYSPAPLTTAYYPPATVAPPRQFGVPHVKPAVAAAAKAQSFVDKTGGYQSPYDLPMEVVKSTLSKRVSMPQMSPALTSPPPRQSSFGVVASPPLAQGTFRHDARPVSSNGPHGTTLPKPKTSSGPKQAFFEELPIAKARPSSKYQPPPQIGMTRSGSLPGVPPPPGPSPLGFTGGASTSYIAPPPQAPPPSLGPAPVLHSRYAPAPTPPAQSQSTSIYASPPPAPTSVPPHYPAVLPTPPSTANYSPATIPVGLPLNPGLMSPPQFPSQRSPSAPLPSTGTDNRYASKPVAALQQLPPSQRQVSAPLTFGSDGGSDGSQPQSQQHSPTQARILAEQHHLHSSGPGTAKSTVVAGSIGILTEEDESGDLNPAAPPAVSNTKYAPRSTATPPPPSGPMRGLARADTLSPPARTGSPGVYSAHPSRTASPESFAPPRRAQTQSPSTVMNGPNRYQTSKHAPRPASALAGNVTTPYSGFSAVEQHTRSMSSGIKSFVNDSVNFMPPTDTSVHDPLNRWQGCPIFSWGFGGHIVTMFPTRTQRNAIGMTQPMIKCSPGEVKIRHTRDVFPLEESLVKFPGPIYTGGKGTKSKKKEVVAWMTERIETLEKEAASLGMYVAGDPDTERKRKEEKILLWKGMKTLLENDGILEGPEIEKNIRAFLSPEDLSPTSAGSFSLVASMNSSSDTGLGASLDRVDAEPLKAIKTHLLNGDRTAAVWHAVDKRLYSHAMLIAGTVSQDLWKQVVQDFVRNQVKTLGSGLESLAVLYEIFGGNGEESMDELVPQSARMGQPMMMSITGTVAAANPSEGLEKWRETLALIISNRSAGDPSALIALGKLLATYGRVGAAHLCYLFARNNVVFSGSDDPAALVTLFGADHVDSPYTFWNDVDAILLSEIYELAVSLAPTPAAPGIIPHLQSIKMYHAFMLAENGHRTEAHKYCEAIASVLKTSGKPSPYFHRTLFNALEDLTNRVSQSPKDVSTGGWLSKPSLDNISGSMWGAFTKFVAGDDSESVASGIDGGPLSGGLEPGPFGRMSSSPGNMSRTQSTADIYGSYGGMGTSGGSSYSPTMTKHPQYNPSNLYAQQQGYAPRNSLGANPYDSASSYNPYDPGSAANAYKPAPVHNLPSQQLPYTPGSSSSPYMVQGGYQPSPAQSTFDSPNPNKGTFDSPSATKTTFADNSAGYQPPSYEPPTTSTYGGYEPPSNDSHAVSETADKEKDSEDEKPKPKKKSFMDDDDDDAEFLARAAALKKEEEEKKKQEEEGKKNTAGGSGWFKGWWGKKDPNAANGPIKAKLGEESSFYYDPNLKRWINKKATPEDNPLTKSTLPPPKRSPQPPSRPGSAAPHAASSLASPAKSQSVPPMNTTFLPPGVSSGPSTPTTSAPPMRVGTPGTPSGPPMQLGAPGTPNAPPSRFGTPTPSTPGTPSSQPPPPPPPGTSASAPPLSGPIGRNAPPTRVTTATGGGDILDDLLGGPAGPRKAAKKGRKGRYVDVMST